MDNSVKKQCYTVKELSAALSLGRNSTYELVKKDDFPKIRRGRKILIPIDALEEYLKKHSQPHNS